MKKKRNYNLNLIKKRRSYSFQEVSELLGVHTRTVQTWKKQGLKILDDSTKPFLVLGEELKRFLKLMMSKRRHQLQAGEFFCTKCKMPRLSKPDKVSVVFTNRKLGKNYQQVIVKGVCSECNQSLTLFSSDKKIQELRLLEHPTQLFGCNSFPTNIDIAKGSTHENKHKE